MVLRAARRRPQSRVDTAGRARKVVECLSLHCCETSLCKALSNVSRKGVASVVVDKTGLGFGLLAVYHTTGLIRGLERAGEMCVAHLRWQAALALIRRPPTSSIRAQFMMLILERYLYDGAAVGDQFTNRC